MQQPLHVATGVAPPGQSLRVGLLHAVVSVTCCQCSVAESRLLLLALTPCARCLIPEAEEAPPKELPVWDEAFTRLGEFIHDQ